MAYNLSSKTNLVVDPDARWVPIWNLVQLSLCLYQYVKVRQKHRTQRARTPRRTRLVIACSRAHPPPTRSQVTSCAAFMWAHSPKFDTWCVLDWIADTMLLLNVILQLVIGFVDASNNKVMVRADIRRNYLHSNRFLIHMAVAVPLDLGQLGLMAWNPLFRLNKVFRLLEVPAYMKLVFGSFRVSMHYRRLMLLVLLVLLFSHTISCLFFLLGTTLETFFPTLFELVLANSSAAFQYLDSTYYSLGLMTGLSDGEVPQTPLESAFTLVVMLLGIFTFATIVGSVSTIVDELSEAESIFQTKLLFMSRMLKQYKMPSQLESRVMNYYAYQWSNHQGFDDFKVLQSLPSGLRTDVLMQQTRTMIEKVPFFQGQDEGFVRSLVDRLKPQVAAAGEIVVKKGDVGTEMFFVHRGELDVMVGNPPVIVAKLRQGNYFGEALLIRKPRSNSIQANTFCDLFALTRDALEEVLDYYPETARTLHALATRRVEEDRRKERQAELVSKYGQKWLQLLYNARTRREEILQRNLLRSRGSRNNIRAVQSFRLSHNQSFSLRQPHGERKSGNFSAAAANTFRRAQSFRRSHSFCRSPSFSLGSSAAGKSVPPKRSGSVERLTATSLVDPTYGNKPGDDDDDDDDSDSDDDLADEHVDDAEAKGIDDDDDTQKDDASTKTPSEKDLSRTSSLGHAMFGGVQSFRVSQRGGPKTKKLARWLNILGLIRSRSTYGDGQTSTYVWVILPNGLICKVWLATMVFAVLWNVILIPVSIAFFFDEFLPAKVALDLFFDCVYLADIFLTMRLAYIDDQGILIKDARQIYRRYYSSGMRVAVLSLVHLDFIQLVVWQMIPALRLPRLLRAPQIFDLSGRLYQAFSSVSLKASPKYTAARILHLCFLFLLVSHYIACFAGLLSTLVNPEVTYEIDLMGEPISTTLRLYLRALYYAVSNLTGLGRDIKPTSIEEHIFTLIVWMLGIFVVAYLVGAVGVLVSNFDAGEMRFNKKRNAVDRYMIYQKVSNELRFRASSFFEYLWAKTKGVEIREVVADLNPSLKRDIMSHICRDAVNSVPVFASRGDEFISAITEVLSFQAFPQSEWLTRKGTIGREMFFILKGQVDIIVNEQLMFVMKTLSVGDFVGEGALFQKQGKTNASVLARESCDTMVLTKDGFSQVLARYPDIADSIAQIGNERRRDTQAAIKALDRRLSTADLFGRPSNCDRSKSTIADVANAALMRRPSVDASRLARKPSQTGFAGRAMSRSNTTALDTAAGAVATGEAGGPRMARRNSIDRFRAVGRRVSCNPAGARALTGAAGRVRPEAPEAGAPAPADAHREMWRPASASEIEGLSGMQGGITMKDSCGGAGAVPGGAGPDGRKASCMGPLPDCGERQPPTSLRRQNSKQGPVMDMFSRACTGGASLERTGRSNSFHPGLTKAADACRAAASGAAAAASRQSDRCRNSHREAKGTEGPRCDDY